MEEEHQEMIFSRKASFINRNADGTIVIDLDNAPSYRPFTLGRTGIAAPNTMPDSAIISQNEFDEAMKGITVQQKWAKDQKFDKTSALLKVEAFIKNLLQPIGVFSLIDSVTVNGVDWPLVTIPFYSNPVAIPIVMGDGFGANSRNTERTRCEESATRLDLLDSAVKGFIWQTIKSNGDEKESMMKLPAWKGPDCLGSNASDSTMSYRSRRHC